MAASVPSTEKGRATRQRILEAAAQLVADHGSAAVTLDDVQRLAGVGRSQLYHYFEGRDDLLRAVVATTADALLDAQQDHLDDLDSLAGIDRWFDALVAEQEEREAVGGCPIGSLASQLAEHDEETRLAFVSGFERWERPLIAGLARMQERGELHADIPVAVLADAVMAALQGGLLLTQVRRDPDQLRRALEGVRTLLVVSGAV